LAITSLKPRKQFNTKTRPTRALCNVLVMQHMVVIDITQPFYWSWTTWITSCLLCM